MQWRMPHVRQLTVWQKLLLIGLTVSITSQVFLQPADSGFRISASAIIYPVMLMLLMRSNQYPLAGMATACTVFLFRVTWWSVIGGTQLGDAALSAIPGAMFYLCYDCMFCLMIQKRGRVSLVHIWIGVALSDFLSNLFEVGLGSIFLYSKMPASFYYTIFVIALVRASCATAILWWVGYYRKMLLVEQHERRYHRLFMMTAQLKDELYFLRKGIDEIEEVMTKAYRLYEQLSENPNISQELPQMALEIAKDIHEIKKDDLSIVRGLKSGVDEVYDQERMKFSDLMKILEHSTMNTLNNQVNVPKLEFHVYHDFQTKEHYRLLSVIKNLVTNAIEAIGENHPNGHVEIIQDKEGDAYTFLVQDNGPGIKNRAKDSIFEMGYSTKFDPETGDINRGVGLVVVRSIVEKLSGTIEVSSQLGQGSTFLVKIPCAALEEESDENLHH